MHRRATKKKPDVRSNTLEQAALRYLARQDRTEAQLKEFLRRKGASMNLVSALAARFLALGYLNDAAYAVRWGRARLARLPMGRERLLEELLGQGLTHATAIAALEEVLAGQPERELACACLTRHSRGRGLKTPAQAAGLLRRYGFSEDTIESVLKEAEGVRGEG